MAKKHDFERWREIRAVHKNYGEFYRGLAGVSAAALLVLLGILIGRSDDAHPDFWVRDLSPFWVGGILA